jgi:anti-sigma B factor antagonist
LLKDLPTSVRTPLEVREAARRDGEVVMTLVGELDLAGAPLLEERLRATEALDGRLVLDLRELRFIDATGLTALVEAHNRREADGRGLRITAQPGLVLRMLELCGLDRLFEVSVVGTPSPDGASPG